MKNTTFRLFLDHIEHLSHKSLSMRCYYRNDHAHYRCYARITDYMNVIRIADDATVPPLLQKMDKHLLNNQIQEFDSFGTL